MIILTYKPGRLGNCLFLFARFIAFSIHYNVKVFNPSFYEYIHLFPWFKRHPGYPYSWYPLKKSCLIIYIFFNYMIRILYKWKLNIIPFILLQDKEYRMDDVQNVSALTKKIVFAYGWPFLTIHLATYREQLIEIFKPSKQHLVNIDCLIEKARREMDLLIGVHIRHEDYKEFMGGKYFYSISTYADIMLKCVDLFSGKNIRFLICSNGNILSEDFNNLNVILGNNHFLEDMYSFSKCDFIVGPPSTYTMWASFYGAVPLYQIEDERNEIKLDDFKVIKY